MIRRLRRPLAAAVLVGLLAAAISAFFLVSNASEADGWPVERAEVIAVEVPGATDGLLDGCGRSGGPAREITLRSADPPPGLDETFVIEDECYADEIAIGEVWPVARVVDGDGDVTPYTYPQPPGAAVRTSLLIGGCASVGATVLLCARGWWKRAQERPGRIRY